MSVKPLTSKQDRDGQTGRRLKASTGMHSSLKWIPRAQESLAQELACLTEISRLAVSILDIYQFFTAVTDRIRAHVGFDRASIVVIDPQGNRPQLHALALVAEYESNYREGTYPLKGTAQEWVLKNRRVCVEGNLDRGRFKEDTGLSREGIRSSVRIPLILEDKVIGTLNLDSRRRRVYTRKRIRFLEQVSYLVAFALERASLSQKALRKAEDPVTVYSPLEARIRDKFQQVWEMERKRALLTGIIAHDLKNPILAIRKYVASLAANGVNLHDKNVNELLLPIWTATESVLGILNDMLDVYRYEFDDLPLCMGILKLEDALEEALVLLKGEIQEKNIDLKFNDLGIWISGDHRRLVRVFVNLIDNAIKFSPRNGRIRIGCSQKSGMNESSDDSCERNNLVKIFIEDEGPGIPPEHQFEIFDLFYQINQENDICNLGTGLGLAFCKMIIEAHGGRIQVVNNLSGGARFILSLPRQLHS